ncbi:MAG: IS5 family transposase, partial [bacterium]|nr:IS5 family transposase [bacterium]
MWTFKEKLKHNDNEKKLFECFYTILESQGLIVDEGKMVDASFHEVPRQRNSREENTQIKEGQIPNDWKNNAHKLSHKDTDARWTKKNGVNYYGYKNHIKADTKSKLIESYTVTDASVHDSQTLEKLLDEKDKGQPLYADSAYTGENQEATIEEKKMINRVHEKGYRNTPLTETQKENNRGKSKIRARIEHIFGHIENSMDGPLLSPDHRQYTHWRR